MRTLPIQMIRLLVPFAPLFSKRLWLNAQVLLIGAFPQLRADELLGMFSLVSLFAHQRMRHPAGTFRRQTGWYQKAHPTFADALALVRKELWAQEQTFYGSPWEAETVRVPRAYLERLTDALCYAA